MASLAAAAATVSAVDRSLVELPCGSRGAAVGGESCFTASHCRPPRYRATEVPPPVKPAPPESAARSAFAARSESFVPERLRGRKADEASLQPLHQSRRDKSLHWLFRLVRSSEI